MRMLSILIEHFCLYSQKLTESQLARLKGKERSHSSTSCIVSASGLNLGRRIACSYVRSFTLEIVHVFFLFISVIVVP